MLFSSSFDGRKANPLIYVKPACPRCCMMLSFLCLLLLHALLLRLERCQSWFLRNIFYVSKFAPGPLEILTLSCLTSVESETATRKLLLLDRLINEPKMSPAERKASLTQILHHWVFCPALQMHHTNMSYFIASKIVRDKIFDFERRAWDSFCESHPNMRVVQSCLENVSPFRFWSLADQFPDLVSRLHVQVRLNGNLCLNGSLPWLQNTDGAICFICKEDIESVTHFFRDCSYFRNNFESLWDKLKIKIARSTP